MYPLNEFRVFLEDSAKIMKMAGTVLIFPEKIINFNI